MLFTSGIEDVIAPTIEGEIELHGVTYPLMKAQPLPHRFHWDDKRLVAETRTFCLNDVGNGKSLTIMLPFSG
jgi:hypothetical protein